MNDRGWIAPAPDLEKTVIDEKEKGFPYNGKGEEAWYMGTSFPLSFIPTSLALCCGGGLDDQAVTKYHI